MPTVRKLQRQVSTNPLPGVRLTSAETPQSRGAGLAEAKGRTAQALGELGGTVGGMALREYAGQRQQAIDHANKVARLSWQNKLAEWNESRIYDAQTGALVQQGEASFELPEKLELDFKKYAAEIKQKLTPEQKLAFDADRLAFESTWKLNVERHVGEQIGRHEATEFQSVLKNAVNEATASALDPNMVNNALQRGLEAIQTHAPTLGMGREAQANAVATFTSDVHVAVINNLLANGEDRRASIYFEEVRKKGGIIGDALTDTEAKLDVASTEAAGGRAADAIWTAQGPTSDTAPVNIDRMSDAARKQFENDPKTLKVVLQSLRERATEHNAAQQERRNANESAVWLAYNQGAKVADLWKMPAYLDLPGATQANIRQHVVDRAHELEQRARGLTRQALEDQRVADARQEREHWAEYWQVSDPRVLATMSDAQVINLTPKLGLEHVNKLMTQKRTLSKSEDAVRTATIDDELFRSIAAGAGLRPYQSEQSESDKAVLGELKNRVEAAIDAEQQRHGRSLSRDEKQSVMRSIVDEKVMLDRRFGTDPTLPAATVINQKDREAAYVPWTTIPKVNQKEWIRVVRSNFANAQGLSDDQILARFRDRIQRAHAAVILGLGDQEALRRITGGSDEAWDRLQQQGAP